MTTLQLFPPTVEFVGVDFGPLFVISVTIKNHGKKVRRIRIKKPETSFFRVSYLPSMAIAPGLEAKFDVEFRGSEERDYHDRLIVTSEGDEIEVPLNAFAPCAKIEFKSLVNMGVVKQGSKQTRYVEFKNVGQQDGRVDLEWDEDLPIKITPKSFELGVSASKDDDEEEEEKTDKTPSKQTIRIDFTGTSLGDFRGLVDVRTEGSGMFKTLDINANVVEHRLALTSRGGGETDTIEFGTIHYKETQTVRSELVNNGPESVFWRLKNNADKNFSVSPVEGTIRPYSSQVLTCVFKPEQDAERVGFSSVRDSIMKQTIDEIKMDAIVLCQEQELKVRFQGRAAVPLIKISPRGRVNFQECPIGARKDHVFVVKNMSSTLPITCSASSVAHFRVQQSESTLRPLQSTNITVSFKPSQLGSFRNTLHLVVNDGITILPIRVEGCSRREIHRRGPEQDDEQNSKVTSPEASRKALRASMKKAKTAREMSAMPWRNDEIDTEAIRDGGTKFTFSVKQMESRHKHKKSYTNFIRTCRAERLNKMQKSPPRAPIRVEDAGLNLGIRFDDLKEPMMSLPDPPKELWLKRPLDRYSKTKLRVHNSRKIIKLKHKSKPTTKREIRDCSQTLSRDDLKRLSIGPEIIEFDRVSTGSTKRRTLSAYNDLNQNVLIQVVLSNAKELKSKTTCLSQVVPPHSVAGFDLILLGDEVGELDRQLIVMINEQHSLDIKLRAEVIPVQIVPSKSRVEFQFADDNLDASVSEIVTLKNPGTAPAKFLLKCSNPCFSVSPSTGVLNAAKSKDVLVTFTPRIACNREEKLEIQVEGGKSSFVHCSGQIEDADIQIVEENDEDDEECEKNKNSNFVVDFDKVSVGRVHRRKVRLKNFSTDAGVFSVNCNIPGVTVIPETGRIEGRGCADITVTLHTTSPSLYDGTLSFTVFVRCGISRKVRVTARSVMPRVSIQEEGFNFGQVALGAKVTSTLTAYNEGEVPAILVLDMPSDDFEVNSSEDHFDDTTYQDKSKASLLSRHVDKTRLVTFDREDGDKIYLLEILPKQSLPLSFVFQPSRSRHFEFDLPVTVVGMRSVFDSLKRRVIARAVPSRVGISEFTLNFGDKIVSRDVARKVPYQKKITLVNEDDKTLKWQLGTKEFHKQFEESGVLRIEPSQGVLNSEKSCEILITFTPDSVKDHHVSVPLYLDDNLERSYHEIVVLARGVYPKLDFDSKEVVMSPVPLGVTSKATFFVINRGYDNLQVRVHLPKDKSKMPLEVEFPEGQLLGFAKHKIPVEVSFSSKIPLSFSARVDFLDDKNNRFSVNVSGLADNCILSNYDFIRQKFRCLSPTRGIDDDGEEEEQLDDDGDDLENDESLDNKNPDDEGKVGEFWDFQVSEQHNIIRFERTEVDTYRKYPVNDSSMTADFLVRWLNANILKDPPLESFPGRLRDDDGESLIALFEELSGKDVLTGGKKKKKKKKQPRTPTSPSNADRLKKSRESYSKILSFLESFGGLAHCISPDTLLSRDLFLRAHLEDMNRKRDADAYAEHRKVAESKFQSTSRKSWIVLVMQIVKVFLLKRVYPKWYASLPGIVTVTKPEDDQVSPPSSNSSPKRRRNRRGRSRSEEEDTVPKSDPLDVLGTPMERRALKSSNVYSVPENILIRWLEHHFKISNPDRPVRYVKCFGEDMKDGVILCSLLLSHCPHLSKALGGPMDNVKYLDGSVTNVKSAIRGMRALKLEFIPTEQDILNPSPRNMLLTILSLITSLPAYIPKATIHFEGIMGEPTQKQIVLRNPSKSVLQYEATLEGDRSFCVDSKTLVIQPKAKTSLPIEFRPRFSRPSKARLVLHSRRCGALTAATLVFEITSGASTFVPIRKVRCETPSYELRAVDIEVRNPFQTTGQFKLSLNESCKGFFLNTTELSLNPSQVKKVRVWFLPLACGKYDAKLSFVDLDVGEFLYEILGNATEPRATESVEWLSEMRPSLKRKIRVSVQNPQIKITKERLMHQIKNVKIRRKILKVLEGASIASRDDLGDVKIEIDSPFFQARVSEEPYDFEDDEDDDVKSITSSSTKIEDNIIVDVNFSPQDPGFYTARILVRFSKIDVRVFEIRATVQKPSSEKTLFFESPARQRVTQDIPIFNNSAESWILAASFTGSSAFSGPSQLVVQANSKATYALRFEPCEMSEKIHGALKLEVAKGSTPSFSFDLHGKASEPLAEDHVVISAKARTRHTHKFTVRNDSDVVRTYSVVSDIPSVSGDSTIRVAANSEKAYVLTFSPQLGGTYSGTLTFEEKSSSSLQWYAVQLNVESPGPEDTLEIETVARQAVSLEIMLKNPLSKSVVFDVMLNGNGLIGDSKFEIEPQSEKSYTLLYSPLIPGTRLGSIAFLNEEVGEYWYELKLHTEPSAPVMLKHEIVEIGSYALVSMRIENPSNESVELLGRSSNSRVFRLESTRHKLEPYETKDVTVKYVPSQLETKETSRIIWSSSKIGSWTFDVSGHGVFPSKPLDAVVMYGEIKRGTSAMVLFENPFSKPLCVRVSIQDENLREVQLLLKNSKRARQLRPFGSLQIPILFQPESVTRYETAIRVCVVNDNAESDEKKLEWIIPIRAIGECAPWEPKIRMECRARQSLKQELSLKLPNLSLDDEVENFEYRLNVSEVNSTFVRNSFDVKPVLTQLRNGDQALQFDLTFQPLCTFRENGEFIVQRQRGGGRWRFKLQLEADEPEVDDVIKIEAPIHHTASVSFELNNITSSSSTFRAFFTSHSPPQFEVYPKEGVLEPLGQNPTKFVVSFSPKEYGQTLIGKLVIQTEEMQWSYEIRGRPPKYRKPKGKSRVRQMISPSNKKK